MLQQPSSSWTNGYTWDAARRLSTETSQAGTFTYTYSAGVGTATSAASLIRKLLLPNSSYITNTFDNVARLSGTYLDNSSNTVLDKSEYLYAGNQRIRQTRTDGSYYTNNYDKIGQLVWADSTVASEDRGYLYDAAWNLNVRTNNGATSTFVVDNKNQISSGPYGQFSYDNNGNLTSTSNGPSYSYDDENRLISISYSTVYRSDFAYDGLSRLRRRIDYTWGGSSWITGPTTYYVYDGMRVIQERDSGNTPTFSYTRGIDLSGTWESAGGIGGLLARSHGYSSGSWTGHNFYHADGNGNITMLIDNAGTPNVTASYRYDPFGNSISATGTNAVNNVYRFSSKERHAGSGMYYYGYRFYDPNLQRWLNRDPIEEMGGINLYTYVANTPISFADLFGLKDTMPYPGIRPRPPTSPPSPPEDDDGDGGDGDGFERCLEILNEMIKTTKELGQNPYDGGIAAAIRLAQLSAEWKAHDCDKYWCPVKPAPRPPKAPLWKRIPPIWRWPMLIPWWWGPGGIPHAPVDA